MKAIHKYKNSKHPEAQRRIAQSMGYSFSIWDMPQMVELLRRADIHLDNDVKELKDGDTISI